MMAEASHGGTSMHLRAALACDGNAEATYACLGKRPNCGQCLEEAQEIIDAERAAARCDFLAVEAA